MEVCMSRISVDSNRVTIKDNGLMKRIPLHTYVVVLTAKDGCKVQAIRCGNFENQYAVRDYIMKVYGVHWNIKEIRKLYDSDFDA